MNIRARSKSLTTRIIVPVLLLSLLGGIGLYYAVQRTFAQFSERQVSQFLSSMAATIYLICDGGGYGPMNEPQPRDPKELRIHKAHALGAIENLLRQNGLIGFVDAAGEHLALNDEVPAELQDAFLNAGSGRKVALIRHAGRRYAVAKVFYRPWKWNIVIARERTAYAAILQDTRGLYLHISVLIGLTLIAFLFVMEEAVRRPVRAIIEAVRRGGEPRRTGIAEFDFLTEQLQAALRKRHSVVESLEKNHFLYSHDVNGNFTYLSPSIMGILGYLPEEFRTHYSAYLTDHPVNSDVTRHTTLSIQGHQQPPYEVEIYHKDGSRHWLEVSEVPVFDESGKVIAVEGIAHDITAKKKVEQDRERLVEDLRKAMADIKTLQGIIPICATCKKVRDDKGAWQQVEAYIREHSDAQFSHGLCPDCLEKDYPGFGDRKKPGK